MSFFLVISYNALFDLRVELGVVAYRCPPWSSVCVVEELLSSIPPFLPPRFCAVVIQSRAKVGLQLFVWKII